MNKTQEALKMAIEALEDAQNMIGDGGSSIPDYFKKHINACKEALAECEQAEPVAWCDSLVAPKAFATNIQQRCTVPLYTVPQDQTAEIAELEKIRGQLGQEAIDLHCEVAVLTKTNTELQANINELREALEIASATLIKYEIDCGEYTTKEHENTVKKLKQALTKTPAQSLASFENEVIEKCAKVCDEYADDPNECDFFLYEESGDVSCDRCIKLHKHPAKNEAKPLKRLSVHDITMIIDELCGSGKAVNWDVNFANAIMEKMIEINK